MATRVQKTKVGIFMLISAVIIIGGLMLVAGYRQGEHKKYIVVFDKTVLGLYKGGLVQYLGVPVGIVDDIYVGEDGQAYVEILIDPKKVVLHRGVDAKLEFYSFATGTMCVALAGGDPNAEELPPGSLIPIGQSQLESFSSQAADLMEAFNKIADKIGTGMEGMEEGELTEIVDQIKPFIDDTRAFIADARDTLKTVQADLHNTIEDARPGIKKLSEFADNANELSKTANETLKDVRAKIEPLDMAKIQTEVVTLSQQLQETVKRLQTMSDNLVYGTDNMQHGLVTTLQQLNETMESIRQLAETLNRDPSSVVRGRADGE